ncbi:hypothetical protein DFS34DRAFT_647772 [Phlyctochytrium arcticum]|nr:hypothetical protein DFS34DRAFT_647772 [Phlyctochytrium arcticum]
MHVWALDAQSLTIELTLNDPSAVFTAGTVDEIRFDNIVCQTPYTTPHPEFVPKVVSSINSGNSIFYDYIRTTQLENACSGGTKNTFNLHMSGVRSLTSFRSCFVDDDVISDRTKDKALSFSSQGLTDWRIGLGPSLFIPASYPFTHGATDPTTLLVTELSNNASFEALGDMDISFDDFDQRQFAFGWSFQSRDEGSTASLSFTGTDSVMKIETTHNPAPSQKVCWLTQYNENVTLAIGPVVKVI